MLDEPGLLAPRSRRLRGSQLVTPQVQGHQGARGFPPKKLQAAPAMLGGGCGRWQEGLGGRLSPPRPCSGGEQPTPATSPISLGGVGSSRVPQAQSRVQEDEAAKAKQAASPWGSDNTSSRPRVPAHLPSHQQPARGPQQNPAKLHPHSAPVTQGADTKISPSTKPLRSWEQEITTGTGPAPHRGSACPGGPWSPPVLRVHSYTLVLNLPGFFPRIIKYI